MNFPRVWCTFTGKRSGKRYRIQDAENSHHEHVKRLMAEYFLREEPTCKYQNCAEDKEFLKELDVIWTKCLQANLSIVCIDEEDENDNAIAGFLLLTVATPNDEHRHPVNEKWAKICNIMEYITKEADPFKNLNIPAYLTDLGLLSLPEYRKEGVGEYLLKTCDAICKHRNIPATVITFSSYKSQNLAKKVGMLELYSKSFQEMRKVNPTTLGIDNIEEHTPDIKYMYKTYENQNNS